MKPYKFSYLTNKRAVGSPYMIPILRALLAMQNAALIVEISAGESPPIYCNLRQLNELGDKDALVYMNNYILGNYKYKTTDLAVYKFVAFHPIPTKT